MSLSPLCSSHCLPSLASSPTGSLLTLRGPASLYFFRRTLWERVSCAVSDGTEHICNEKQELNNSAQQPENFASAQTLHLEIAGAATNCCPSSSTCCWEQFTLMQPLCCGGRGGPTQGTADAEVLVETIIPGHRWGSGIAQDPAVLGAMQTHNWRICPCPKDLPIGCWSFFSRCILQHELAMPAKERSLPCPFWACTSSLPSLGAAVHVASGKMDWRNNPGLCKLNGKEKRKKEKKKERKI